MLAYPNKSESSSFASQKVLIREIEWTVESYKKKFIDRLESIKRSYIRKVVESTNNNNNNNNSSSKKNSSLTLDIEALENFEKKMNKELEVLQTKLTGYDKPFFPTISHTIQVCSKIGFNYGANVYNEKHNMIISCPSNCSIFFIDATHMSIIKQRQSRKLASSVVQTTYCPENDTHLLGCAFGQIYSYNARTNSLKNVYTKEGKNFILAISHLDTDKYVFSSSTSGKLFLGSLKEEKVTPFYSKDSDPWYLFHQKEKNLLYSGLGNGKLCLYNTKKISKLPMIHSIQAHRFGKYLTSIIKANIKGKEYIITGGNDQKIKLWDTNKGRIRLIKTIQANEDISTIIYLEEYQMLATSHHREYIKFWKLPFGNLEAVVNLGLEKVRNLFLMRDKNALGAGDLNKDRIQVIQLQPTGNQRCNIKLIEDD